MVTALNLGKTGQLGNQIFQYAALLGIHALHGYEVVLPRQWKRGSYIDSATGKKIRYSLSLDQCFDLPEKFVPIWKLWGLKKVHERWYHFDPAILEVDDQTGLWGFFESERYFEHCKDLIRSRLQFKPVITERATERMVPYRRSGKSLVAVHVRRGQDRPKFQHFHPLTPIEYYKDAMALFAPGEHDYLIFTDDFEWCGQQLPEGKLVQWDTGFHRPDFVDLCMMTQCDHHIIANSSFSWWGAWLNPSLQKRVIAPALWFGPAKREANGDPMNINDNIPANWIRM